MTDEFEDFSDIESLLGELDVTDHEQVQPPPDVWASIEPRVAQSAPVAVLADRRRPVVAWFLGAAAAVALIVAGTIAVFGSGTEDAVVSAAVLTFDPSSFDPRGADASAQAHLVDNDGRLAIRLTDTSFPSLDDDDLELWLIEPDADGNPVDVAPVALVDSDGDGTYELPAGLDPTTHFVVDISIEPRDGVATHSGQSVLRGALAPV
jgi:anti-sigma-K factor RskA